jgi:hypothetical protein
MSHRDQFISSRARLPLPECQSIVTFRLLQVGPFHGLAKLEEDARSGWHSACFAQHWSLAKRRPTMLRRVVSVGGFLLLVGVLATVIPGSAQAANRAFAGVRIGGFGGGFHRAGFYGRPYAPFGFRPYYRPNLYAYPYRWAYSAYPYYFNDGAYNSYYYVPPSTWDDWKFSDHDVDLSATYLPPSPAPAGGYQSSYSATSLPADAKASFTVNVPDEKHHRARGRSCHRDISDSVKDLVIPGIVRKRGQDFDRSRSACQTGFWAWPTSRSG